MKLGRKLDWTGVRLPGFETGQEVREVRDGYLAGSETRQRL